ncbi:MAG: sigma-70 family RNA polymerase sigma factor [Myxococcales bacterium]|nr:sigma-70 family RNA polymerase sigma factor [Myxococcales bacterium]
MGQAITDDELVAASRRGERAAFGALIERHLDAVWAVSFSRTRDRALSDDVAQDTFVAAWAQLDRLREASRLRAWLCGIARNLARKARRRAGRERPDDQLAPTDVAGSPYDALARVQTDRVVERALAELPASYREVLVLYYQHERSIRDVASALGIREEAAMQRLTRGRRLLAAHVVGEIDGALVARKPRKATVAAVLAVLPPRSPSVNAWPLHSVPPGTRGLPTPAAGARMLKIAALVFVTAGAVGTTYVATRGDAAASHRAPVAAPVAAPTAVAPAGALPPPPTRAAATRPTAPPRAPAAAAPAGGSCDPGAGAGACAGVEIVDGDQLDPAAVEATGLYRGPSRGPADAPVQIAVFQDLECPYCAKVIGTIDQLWDEYPGQLRLVVKDFPLPHHARARLAAEATRAADAQGKLWEFRDLCLAFQEDLDRDALIALAARAGLDVARFTADLDGHRFAAAVDADLAAGATLEVQGTPAFFINGRRFTGAQPIDAFRAAIDAALADAAP